MKQSYFTIDHLTTQGGPGSGNFGHAGRLGKTGGSRSGGGMSEDAESAPDYVDGISSTAHAKEVEKQCNFAAEQMAGYSNLSVSEYISQTEAAMKDVLSDSVIAIRVTPESLNSILADQRFKTQYETKTSGGGLVPKVRKKFESDVMNYQGKAQNAPIYGYVTKSGNPLGQSTYLNQYGNAAVILKQSVKSRTTFTDCDSLDINANSPRVIPSLITKPSVYSSYGLSGHSDILGMMKDPGMGLNGENTTYYEAQIHGGVKVQHIEKVIFQSKPSTQTIASLTAHNIPYEVKD